MRWLTRQQSAGAPAASPTHAESKRPSPDDAWMALALVVDWIKHAETKAVATLAASGVVGGVLYTLAENHRGSDLAFRVAATACGVFAFGAGLGAGMVLRPRLRSPEEPTNLLYYDHIARMYRTGVDAYVDSLTALMLDHRALVDAIAGQIWANAHVARRKYRWGGVGIVSLLLALLTLALTALLDAIASAS
jgi:hypothetical protein